jgi:hypothetical protein
MIVIILYAVVTAYPQSDSVKHESEASDYHQRPDPSKPSDAQPAIPENNPDRDVNPLIRIRMDGIPFRMRRALEAQKYDGWDQSSVFQNSKTFHYSIDIRHGDSIRTFSFDRIGNPID